MSRLFPFRSPAEIQDESPRVLSLSGDEADDVFAALSSGTARALLAALYDEPRPTSEVADALDTSIQNARYHLGNLQDAGLVEVVDTWYSEQGNEMKVYAPTNGALVLFEGQPESHTTLRDAVTRLLGGVGVLALAALLIDRGSDLFRGLVPRLGSSGDAGGGETGGGGADGGKATTAAADGDGGDGGDAGDGGDVGDGGDAGDGGGVGDGGDAVTTTDAAPPEPTQTTAEEPETVTQTTADGTTAATRTSTEPTTAETTAATTRTYTTEATQATPEATQATTQTYTPEATQATVEATQTAAPTAEPATTTGLASGPPPGAFEAVTGVPLTPGVAFFLGGLVVLLAGFAWWYHASGSLT